MTERLKRAAALLAALILCSGTAAGVSGIWQGSGRFLGKDEIKNMTAEETGTALNDNYYAYINFEKLKKDEIPYGEKYLGNDDWTEAVLKESIHEMLLHKGEYARGTNEQKMTDIYFQFLDGDTRAEVGISPLEKIMEKIEGAENINELIDAAAELQWDYGVPSLFTFRVGAGTSDSSSYCLYNRQMPLPASADDFFTVFGTAESVQKTIKNVIEYRGGKNSSERAAKCTDMIIEIAENSKKADDIFYEVGDYADMSLSELAGLFGADISPFTERLISAGCESITVCDVKQLSSEAGLLTDENLQAWKDHMITMLLLKYGELLPEKEARLFAPLGKSYNESSEKNAEELIIYFFSNELSYGFSEKNADRELIKSAESFTKEIIASYAEMIRQSTDADNATKERFIGKLENMSVNIGVPGEPYDGNYDFVPAEEGGNFLENIIKKFSGEYQKSFENLGKPFDKTAYDWDGMPPMIYGNAQYHSSNYVTIPYATLTAPYYDINRSKYENLGHLGMIICHEISHGFDSFGIQFNEYGNYDPEWIGGAFGKTLEDKKTDIINLYGSQKLFGIYPLDGEKTLGENMADIAAVQCILSMAETDEQKRVVLESYADNWYMLIYDSAAYEFLYNDEHSLNEFRTNVVVSQMDDFYSVYGITDGKMFTPPENRRRIW